VDDVDHDVYRDESRTNYDNHRPSTRQNVTNDGKVTGEIQAEIPIFFRFFLGIGCLQRISHDAGGGQHHLQMRMINASPIQGNIGMF
jgi:hypothetical protein